MQISASVYTQDLGGNWTMEHLGSGGFNSSHVSRQFEELC